MNKKIIIITTTVTSLILLVGAWLWYRQQPVHIQSNLSGVKVNSPLQVSFSLEINPRFNYNIEPSIPGNWQKVRGLMGVKKLVFRPSKPLIPGSKYKLILGDITKLGDTKPIIMHQQLAIVAETPATLSSLAPVDGARDVPVNPTITAKLKGPNHGLRRLELTSDAAVGLSSSQAASDDQSFSWHFNSPLAQGQTVHIFLDDLNQTDPSKRRLTAQSFTVVAEPHINATQRDHFYPGDAITIGFDTPMKADDRIFKFGFGGGGHGS
jgi:hypothetical protein